MARLVATRVGAGYRGRPVLDDVSVALEAGVVVGVVGPNGGGKTTLVRVLAGACAPRSGSVMLDGRTLDELDRRDVARRIAVVPQDPRVEAGFSALEVVLMGRAPHARGLALAGQRDLEVARAAMAEVDVAPFEAQSLDTLSGGERQRVFLARALAQEPAVLLLDEPTAHLDLRHQAGALDVARRRARRDGVAVLAVLHDLNLAARYCDRVVLLCGGRVMGDDVPATILTADRIAAAFGDGVEVLAGDGGRPPIILPRAPG